MHDKTKELSFSPCPYLPLLFSGEMRPGPGFKTNSAFTNALHAEKGMMFMDEVKTAKQWNKQQQSEASLVNIFSA